MERGYLSFAGLEKRYDDRCVLSIGSLTLIPGRIVHLTGRNGAGKTTLLKILAGLEYPDVCQVSIAGRCYAWQAVRQRLRREVVYLHQSPYMFDDSVANNLGYGLRMARVTRSRRHALIAEALLRVGLQHAARRNARTLSGGEQQRLALARAWVLRPRALLLDEPTANMDLEFRRRIWVLLRDVLRDDLAVMVSSHELAETQSEWDCLNLQDGRLKPEAPEPRRAGERWRPVDCLGVLP